MREQAKGVRRWQWFGAGGWRAHDMSLLGIQSSLSTSLTYSSPHNTTKKESKVVDGREKKEKEKASTTRKVRTGSGSARMKQRG